MDDLYEYEPLEPKRKELLLSLGLLGVALFLLGLSQIPGLPFPAAFQFGMMLFLAASIMVYTRYISRRYSYRVEPCDNGTEMTPPDFTVTEYYSRRTTVVCRISLSDIAEVTRVTSQNRKQLAAAVKGKRVYHYTCHMAPQNLTLLTVNDGEGVFYIRIQTDEKLFSILQNS